MYCYWNKALFECRTTWWGVEVLPGILWHAHWKLGPRKTPSCPYCKFLYCGCTITLGPTRLDNQHISCRSSAVRTSDLAPSDFHLSLHLMKFLSGKRQRFQNNRGGDESHSLVPIPGGGLLRHSDTKIGTTIWQISQFRRWKCWKISQHLLYLY